MKKISFFVLLVLPAVLVITAALLRYSNGPYWLTSNSDPGYTYLLSSLALTEFKQTGTTGHPGTTLQILGAAVLEISHALKFSEKDDLASSVLKNPEFYLSNIHIALLIFNAVLLFSIGLLAFKLTGSIGLSLLLQLSPFLSDTMLVYGVSRISPEALLLFSGLLFVLILMKMTFSVNLSESAFRYAVIFALVSGFGVATKFIFAPLLIIPMVVLPGWRNKIGFLLLTVICFVLWTLPMISQYGNLLKWYGRILTHTGTYGLGDSGFMSPQVYLQDIVDLVLRNILFFLIFLFSVWFILFFGWFSVRGDQEAGKAARGEMSFRILSAVTVAQLVSILIILKHPAERYLLSVLSLSIFMPFLMLVYLKRRDDLRQINFKKIAVFGVVLLTLCGIWRMMEIRDTFMENEQIREEALAVHRKMESEYKDYMKIYCIFLSSSPVGALAFGNYFAIEGLYTEALQKIYGDVYFFDPFNKKFYNWTKDFVIEDTILKGKGSRIVFHFPSLREYGEQIVCSTGSVLHMKDVFGGQYETIYVLDGITLMWGNDENQKKLPSPFPDFSHKLN